MLHPSLTMWCMASSSTCSSAPSRSSAARKSGPGRGRTPAAPPRSARCRTAASRSASLERRQVLHRQGEPAEGRDHLHGRAVRLGEDRPQRLVPADDLAQRALQRRLVQRAAQAPGHGDVVGRRSPAPAGRGTRAAPARRRAAARPCAPPAPRAAAPAAPRGASPPPARASPATVGPSNSARSGSSTPNTSRMRETTRVASSECPPSSKKLSSTPTRSSAQHLRPDPRQHLLRRGARRHVRVRPPTRAPAPAAPCGPACRWASAAARPATTNAAGTMYSGSAPAQRARAAPSASAPPTTYATSRRSPGTSSRATTAASRTPACCRSAASISPGSMRKPRIFTCWSMRPRNSTRPVRQPAHRSPVR